MLIGPVELDDDGTTASLRARITWESSGRAPLDAHVALPSVSAAGLRPDPAPFVAAAAIAAHLHGERRLAVTDPVDPRLADNITSALDLIAEWFGPVRAPLVWETRPAEVCDPAAPLTACLLTGGIDSSALLVSNHQRYPHGHPLRIGAGIVVYDLDPSTAGDIRAPDPFLHDLARKSDLELFAVSTNLRQIEPSWVEWRDRLQAALLVGAARAMAHRVGALLVAASGSYRDLVPYGTHPLLDPLLSSADLAVHHELVRFGRLDRVRIVAGSPAALGSLQVCNRARSDWAPGALNCGRCEKCLRTMVELRAAGIGEPPTFPAGAVRPHQIDELPVPDALPGKWEELPEPLRQVGEPELAEACERFARRIGRRRQVARLKALDRSLLGGRLARTAHALRH